MRGRGGAHRRRRGLFVALLAAGLCSLVAASPASATHPVGIAVEVSEVDGFTTVISYKAAAGQANNVNVSFNGVDTYTITDAFPITDATTTDACTVDSVQTTRAICQDPTAVVTCFDPRNPDTRAIPRIEVSLGDQNDRFTAVPSVPVDTYVFGQDGNDRLVSGDCGSNLNGGAGTDILTGGAGDDEIHPGLDDDSLVSGGSGADTLSYAERSAADGPLKINLTAGLQFAGKTSGPCTQAATNDEFVERDFIDVTPQSQFELVIGSSADDCISGSRTGETIKGGPGADRIAGGLGVDTVDYSDSTSQVRVTLGDQPLNQVPGNDGQQNGGEGDNLYEDVENVIGGPFDDTLIGQDTVEPVIDERGGYEGANTLEGRGGNDFFDGKTDADTFIGGDGIDTVTYAARTEPLVATIDGNNDDGGPSDISPETARGDTIREDVERVLGGSGPDVLRGNAGDNFLDGGAGSDTINGGDGADELRGADGDDLLEGAGGGDTLAGEGGSDDLEGGDHADALDGGDGDDLLDGGTGPDSLGGGAGLDAADYSARLAPVTASADGAGGDGEAGEGDNIGADVEDLIGGIDDDTLIGNGGDGFLAGGGGDDLLDGGGGADDLLGGAGADRATYASRGAPVGVDLNTFGGDGEAGENDEIADDVEKVSGGAANDTIVGDGASNILSGGEGADSISGGGGFDLIHGDGGNDSLNGGAGTDLIFGDTGNDAITGGSENDTLNGGQQNDSLDGATGADVLNGNEGSDTANYASRTSALNITLDGAPNDGQSGEGDLIKTDVENVTAGSGNDRINSADGQTGRVACGRGTDTIDGRDASDTIGDDCENVRAASRSCSVRPLSGGRMSRRGVVRLRVSCPAAGRGVVTLARRVRLGRKTFRISRAGQSRTVSVKLLNSSRRYVLRRNRVRVNAMVALTPRGATKVQSKRRITIREPRGRR